MVKSADNLRITTLQYFQISAASALPRDVNLLTDVMASDLDSRVPILTGAGALFENFEGVSEEPE